MLRVVAKVRSTICLSESAKWPLGCSKKDCVTPPRVCEERSTAVQGRVVVAHLERKRDISEEPFFFFPFVKKLRLASPRAISFEVDQCLQME